MIDAKTTAAIRDYAARAVEERLCGSGDVIAMRTKNGFVVNDGCALSEIDDSRLIEVAAGDTRPEYALLTALFAAREDINAVMITHPAYVCAAARAKVTIPAVVDDMAQIVGVNCKTSRSDSVSDVLAAMKGRNSCLIAGGGALTTGRTLDEACTRQGGARLHLRIGDRRMQDHQHARSQTDAFRVQEEVQQNQSKEHIRKGGRLIWHGDPKKRRVCAKLSKTAESLCSKKTSCRARGATRRSDWTRTICWSLRRD